MRLLDGTLWSALMAAGEATRPARDLNLPGSAIVFSPEELRDEQYIAALPKAVERCDRGIGDARMERDGMARFGEPLPVVVDHRWYSREVAMIYSEQQHLLEQWDGVGEFKPYHEGPPQPWELGIPFWEPFTKEDYERPDYMLAIIHRLQSLSDRQAEARKGECEQEPRSAPFRFSMYCYDTLCRYRSERRQHLQQLPITSLRCVPAVPYFVNRTPIADPMVLPRFDDLGLPLLNQDFEAEELGFAGALKIRREFVKWGVESSIPASVEGYDFGNYVLEVFARRAEARRPLAVRSRKAPVPIDLRRDYDDAPFAIEQLLREDFERTIASEIAVVQAEYLERRRSLMEDCEILPPFFSYSRYAYEVIRRYRLEKRAYLSSDELNGSGNEKSEDDLDNLDNGLSNDLSNDSENDRDNGLSSDRDSNSDNDRGNSPKNDPNSDLGSDPSDYLDNVSGERQSGYEDVVDSGAGLRVSRIALELGAALQHEMFSHLPCARRRNCTYEQLQLGEIRTLVSKTINYIEQGRASKEIGAGAEEDADDEAGAEEDADYGAFDGGDRDAVKDSSDDDEESEQILEGEAGDKDEGSHADGTVDSTSGTDDGLHQSGAGGEEVAQNVGPFDSNDDCHFGSDSRGEEEEKVDDDDDFDASGKEAGGPEDGKGNKDARDPTGDCGPDASDPGAVAKGGPTPDARLTAGPPDIQPPSPTRDALPKADSGEPRDTAPRTLPTPQQRTVQYPVYTYYPSPSYPTVAPVPNYKGISKTTFGMYFKDDWSNVTGTQLSELGASVPPGEHPAQLLTAQTMPKLRPDVLGAASATFFSNIPDAAMAALTPNQAKAIKPEALALTDPSKIRKLTDAALRVMTTAQLEKIESGRDASSRHPLALKDLLARHAKLTAPPPTGVWQRFWNWIKGLFTMGRTKSDTD